MEGLEVPAQENVDAFLPAHCGYAYLDPDHPQALDPMTPGELLMKYRKNHLDAVQAQAKTYTSYTGTPDGVDATIKFVMKVEAPEVPETEALEPTAAVQTEKPSFWQRLKALFGWG